MAKQMNTESLVKKLKSVSCTQDSIPMLSLWIIHHKAHHRKVVDTWLDVLKKSKSQHRLTLLYLCNDVVQNCVRKNAPIYKESFADVLVEAVSHLRDLPIKSNVQRVVKIWAKRVIFDTDFTDQLLAALITNQAPEKLRNKLLVEYKTSALIEEIKKFKVLEDEIETNQRRLKAIRFDVSNLDAIRNLKDKIGGEKFSKDFEESATQLDLFLNRYEKYVEERKILLERLDRGTVYYHAQFHEAKIVVNAYQNFEARVKKMKGGVDKIKEKFAPAGPSKTISDGLDDMEMSDEDKELGNKPSKIVAMETKHRRASTQKPAEKSKLPDAAAESMLKMLTTGLESLQNTNENAAESLKRVFSGLVKRPGMRGASSVSTSDAALGETGNKSLTIVRPVTNDSGGSARSASSQPSPPVTDSPPSPEGSPDLNISSPPRQPLDSRLADLFSEADSVELGNDELSDNPLTTDSDSDTELIKRANLGAILNKHSLLPGLGDLDKIGASLPKPETAKSSAEQPVTATAVSVLPPPPNESISVLSGTSPQSGAVVDGSSTPTLDEAPYTGAAPSLFLSPPKFSGDALSFLTKFMDSATKLETSTSANSAVDVVTTVPSTSSQSSVSTALSQPSPTCSNTTTAVSTTAENNGWTDNSMTPNLPPPPFSWPPVSEASTITTSEAPPLYYKDIPTSWNSSPPTTLPSYNDPQPSNPSNPVIDSLPLDPSPSTVKPAQVFQYSPQTHSGLDQNPIDEPPVKRSKWDIKDTDYRVDVNLPGNVAMDGSQYPVSQNEARSGSVSKEEPSFVPSPASHLHNKKISDSYSDVNRMPLFDEQRPLFSHRRPSMNQMDNGEPGLTKEYEEYVSRRNVQPPFERPMVPPLARREAPWDGNGFNPHETGRPPPHPSDAFRDDPHLPLHNHKMLGHSFHPQRRPPSPHERFPPRPHSPRERFLPRPSSPREQFPPRPLSPREQFPPRPPSPRECLEPRPLTPRKRFPPRPPSPRDRLPPRPLSPRDRFPPRPLSPRERFQPRPHSPRERFPQRPPSPYERFPLHPCSPRERFPPPHQMPGARPPVPRPRSISPERRRSEDDFILHELALLQDEQIRDAELRRDLGLMENLPPVRDSGPVQWEMGVRPPMKFPHPRPRMTRPPHFGGMSPPPRLRY